MGEAASLIAHCGAVLMTREELHAVPTPQPKGRFHRPIQHGEFADALVEVLGDRGIEVLREEYAVQRQDLLFFALDFAPGGAGLAEHALPEGQRHALAGRGSNNSTFTREVGCGRRMMVCDNLTFGGALIAMKRKQTTGFDIKMELGGMLDRYIAQVGDVTKMIANAQRRRLTDTDAKAFIFDAFITHDVMPTRLLPQVARDYFEPTPTEEDPQTDLVEYPRTLWSLHNAFTRAARVLRPQRKFEATAKLGGLLAAAN